MLRGCSVLREPELQKRRPFHTHVGKHKGLSQTEHARSSYRLSQTAVA